MASPNTLGNRMLARMDDVRLRLGKPVFMQPSGYLNRHERRKAEVIARTGRAYNLEAFDTPQPVAAPINAEPVAPEVPPA